MIGDKSERKDGDKPSQPVSEDAIPKTLNHDQLVLDKKEDGQSDPTEEETLTSNITNIKGVDVGTLTILEKELEIGAYCAKNGEGTIYSTSDRTYSFCSAENKPMSLYVNADEADYDKLYAGYFSYLQDGEKQHGAILLAFSTKYNAINTKCDGDDAFVSYDSGELIFLDSAEANSTLEICNLYGKATAVLKSKAAIDQVTLLLGSEPTTLKLTLISPIN